jgi:hypothetical protein
MKESEADQDVELRSGAQDSAKQLSEAETPNSASTPGQQESIVSQNPFDNSLLAKSETDMVLAQL